MNCATCNRETEYQKGMDDEAKPICLRCAVAELPGALLTPVYTTVIMEGGGPTDFRVASSISHGPGTPALQELRGRFYNLRAEHRTAVLNELATRLIERHPDATRSQYSIGECVTFEYEGDGVDLQFRGVYVGDGRVPGVDPRIDPREDLATLVEDDDYEIAVLVHEIITIDPPIAYAGRDHYAILVP